MDVLMPQLGETVTEGKIVKWFKSAGDAVKPGDNLFEIETDKTSMEVPATFGGTLTDINFQVGETAKVGAVVATIAGEGGAATPVKAAPPALIAPAKAAILSPEIKPELGPRLRGDERDVARDFAYPNMTAWREVRTPDRNYGAGKLAGGVFITPLARRLASERGIDLSRVSGSGPHGRIVAADIGTAQPASSGAAMATGASFAQVKALYDGVDFEEVPLDGMRTTITKRLVEAKQTIPHFYLTADIEIDRLMAMREEANAAAPPLPNLPPHAWEGRVGAAFKLSLNDFIIKAWAAALQRIPAANAVWSGDRILRFKQADIGIAVALDGGLITPVIRAAESKSLTAISSEIRDLAERARAKKLKANEYQGGASAISNLGMYGVREFSANINPPHATILAVGASRRAPVEAEDGSVKFVSVMTVTLSCDHRVVDGALGAELLAAFKKFIEMPVTALI
ncbi:MAG: dihydrolipoamide acetyltransferase family protein [Pseudolabrys sp.]|nr:dihydrolipoamide acetyltransferase family protein [Pseudolabrys sp.]